MEELSVKNLAWGVVGVIIGALLISILAWGFRVGTAPIVGKGEAYVQIQSAQFRISAYDSFFNQYGSIKALEGKIDALNDTLSMFEKGSREYNQTVISIAGVKGLRHDAIQKYNADARKSWTEGQFRDNGLPYQIQDTDYPEVR